MLIPEGPCMDHYWGWYCRTVSLFGCCTTDGFFNCKSSCKATCGLCDDEPTPTLTPDPNCEDSATSQTCSVLITYVRRTLNALRNS